MLITAFRDTYKAVNIHKHIYFHPDTYVGSIEQESKVMWILEENEMTQRKICFTPALYKIFDEILMNALEHYIHTSRSTSAVSDIQININNSEISIWNNGCGIPVTMDPLLKKYVPEIIFSELSTGNYAPGRPRSYAGYGSKLCNIFSTEFVIETVDEVNQKYYKQVFRNNMTEIGTPQISDCTDLPWTKVTFIPDWVKLNTPVGISSDTIGLMSRRAYDIAAYIRLQRKENPSTHDCNVFLNNKKIVIDDITQYFKLFTSCKFINLVNSTWDIYIGDKQSVNRDESQPYNIEHISLVNGIWTNRGGKHVNYVRNSICRRLIEYLKNKYSHKIFEIKPPHIQRHMIFFIHARISHPTFDSQLKDYLFTPVRDFPKLDMSDEFLESLAQFDSIRKLLPDYHEINFNGVLKELTSLSPLANGFPGGHIYKKSEESFAIASIS